jgi:hypothetical protein
MYMGIKTKPQIKVDIEYLNQAYRIIKSYLMATEMLGHQSSQKDIRTYKYVKYRLAAYERISKKSKYYKPEPESEELIL